MYTENGSCGPTLQLWSNSWKTKQNTEKEEKDYQIIFLLAFSRSRETKS